MKIIQALNVKANKLRDKGLCPSFLNLNFKKYTFVHLLNDIFAGLKSFCSIIPIAIVFSMISNCAPIQGIISIGIASIVSVFLGGSRYQINSVAWIASIISVDVLTKYQYQGMLATSIMVAVILIIFGFTGLGELLQYMSKTCLTAISVCISLIIIVMQLQVILNIPITYSYRNFVENCISLFSRLKSVDDTSVLLFLIFTGSMVLIKLLFKNFTSYFIYLAMWGIVMWCDTMDIFELPDILSSTKTIGQSFFQNLNKNTILNMPPITYSANVYAELVLAAFSIALVIGEQTCSSVCVSKSLTGDARIQTNMELISVSVSNFLSVATGGLFISPDTDITIQNIKNKSKSIITLLTIACLAYTLLCVKDYIFKYIPVLAISTTLMYMAFHIMHRCISSRYLNLANSDSQIFLLVLFVSLKFGLVSAISIGTIISLMQFTNRLVKLSDPSVHSVRTHDSCMIDFVANKYGYAKSKYIPNTILQKIEVVQLTGILSINQLEGITDIFISCNEFPSVIIIYFKNVPFFDNYALKALKKFVKISKQYRAIVLVTGTNGLLLSILNKKSKEYNSSSVFGYVVPNFSEAVRQTLSKLSNEVQPKKTKKIVKLLPKAPTFEKALTE